MPSKPASTMDVITRSGSSASPVMRTARGGRLFLSAKPVQRVQSSRSSLRVARGQTAACGAARVRAMAAPDWAQLEAADGVRFSWCAYCVLLRRTSHPLATPRPQRARARRPMLA